MHSQTQWFFIFPSYVIQSEMLFSDVTPLAVLAATTLSNMSVKPEIAEAIHASGGVLGFITLLSRSHESLLVNSLRISLKFHRKLSLKPWATLPEAATRAGRLPWRFITPKRETIINNDGLEPIIPLLSIPNPILQKNSVFIVGMLSSNDKFCQVHGNFDEN